MLGFSLGVVGPALTQLRERSGSDIGEIGILFVGQGIGYTITSFSGGRLYDRFDGHRMFAASLLLAGAGLAMIPTFDQLSALFAVFVVVGMGTAMIDVGANTLIIWTLGDRVGRSLNVLHLCFGLGALSAPLLVHAGLDVTTRGAALCSLAFAGWALVVPSPASPEAREEHTTTTRPLLALMASFFVVYVGLEVGFAGWILTYGEEVEFSELAATWLTTVFWIGFTIGRLLASALAQRFRPKALLAAACGVTILAAGAFVVGQGRTGPVWVATALLGVATAPQFPVMLTYLERRIRVTATATSWFVGAAGIGGLVVPWLIGRGIDGAGPGALPWSILILALVTAGTFVAIDRVLGG